MNFSVYIFTKQVKNGNKTLDESQTFSDTSVAVTQNRTTARRVDASLFVLAW